MGISPYKTQKCKGIHSTCQAEIIDIDSFLYPVDLWKSAGSLLMSHWYFSKLLWCKGAWRMLSNKKYFTNNMKRFQHFLGRLSSSRFFCKKIDQKLPDVLALAGIFNVWLNYSIFTAVTWLTADKCHVYGTKHGSDLSIVGSYVTFHQCFFVYYFDRKIPCYIFIKGKPI